MINFTEGKINLGEKIISVSSNCKELESLAENDLIERPEVVGDMHFTSKLRKTAGGLVFLSRFEKNIERLLLRWLDRPMKSWDDVREKAMTDEYHLLSNFVKSIPKLVPIILELGRAHGVSNGGNLI